MASFNGKIYLTTNNITGKIYIGQTTVKSIRYFGSGSIFKKEVKKYGKCNFSRIILRDKIESGIELNFWEDFYISLFDACNKEFGYNVKKKGSNRGYKHSKEAIAKIAERSRKEDNKIRIREIQKIALKYITGVPRTKETKIRIIKAKYGTLKQINIYNKDGSLFNTCDFTSEAVILTGVKISSIKNNLCGLSKSAGDYVFKHKLI